MARPEIIRITGTEGAAPATGSYTPVIRCGDLIFVSGQGPIDADGRIVPGTIEEETRLTMENIRRLLRAAGSDLDRVLRCTCYLADITEFDRFDAAYREAFRGTMPCRTTVQAGLDGIRVEIDAIAAAG